MTSNGTGRLQIRQPDRAQDAGLHTVPYDRATASLIIVTHNGRRYLDGCLVSVVRELDPDDEVIIVDNASTDGGVEIVQGRFPGATLIRNTENRGFAAACNQGAALAGGDVLVFLNQDTRVEPGWLGALVDTLEGNRGVGLTTSKVLLMSQPECIQLCGQDVHFTGLITSRGFGSPSGTMNAPGPVAAVSGASFAIRRDLWQALGGFDEAFYMYYEETDLSWRARLAGYHSYYAPGSVVYHDYRPAQLSPSRFYYSARNRYLMLLKNWRRGTLVFLLPGLVLAEAVDWYLALATGEEGLRAKVRADLWVLGHLGEVCRQRAADQTGRTVTDAAVLAERKYRLASLETASGPVRRAILAICNAAFWLNHRLALTLCRWLGW